MLSRVFAAAPDVLPHEEAQVAVLSPDGARVRHLASTRQPAPVLTDAYERWLLDRPGVPRFGSAAENGGHERAWVRTPLRRGDTVEGVIVLFAHCGAKYSEVDLQRAQWIADVTAMVAAHTGDLDTALGSADPVFEALDEIASEIAHVLDVREVFARVSEIVKRVLPHDQLTMTSHDPSGFVGFRASSTAPTAPPATVSVETTVKVDTEVLARPFVLLPDLTPEGLAHYHPPEARAFMLGTGFQSFLAVNLAALDQRIGVEFWSKKRFAFSVEDVPLARRIGRHVALAVSHHQLAEASRHVAEAQARERDLEERVKTLSAEVDVARKRGRVVGESPEWNRVLRAAAQVARTDTTVLLTGESGSGKEVIARFIHGASNASRGPFVAVNCAALPEQLLESELFGYERGAFTGAAHSKPGQIEIASGGVLFLDEVSEMSMSAQAKFLRVLQEREFRRLGGTRLLHANVRVIAATNCDLRRAIERGVFRRDLYYRLRVFDLRLPPLRERREDILLLADAMLQEIADRLKRSRPQLSAAARNALLEHEWPGNVRELHNVLERAVIVCDGTRIERGHLSFDTEGELPVAGPSANLNEVERQTIERVLRECRGNKSRAAKRLGLSRMQLYVRLRRYQFEVEPN